MSMRVAVICIALIVAGSSVAHAQVRSEKEIQRLLVQPDYARGGYFLGAEALYALENSTLVRSGVSSGAVQIRVGFKHNRWLATELMARYVHTFGTQDQSFLAWGMSVNERLYLMRGRFQPFLTAGPGFLQIRPRETSYLVPLPPPAYWRVAYPSNVIGFAARFGAGFEAYTNENFAITFDGSYTLGVGAIEDFPFITAGIGFQFY